jgi:hypothetical protein
MLFSQFPPITKHLFQEEVFLPQFWRVFVQQGLVVQVQGLTALVYFHGSLDSHLLQLTM